MIDFEEGRISVRLSEGTFYALQADVSNFCFTSPDGSFNENGFYNTILPELHENRISDRIRLRRILEKRFSHKLKPEFNKCGRGCACILCRIFSSHGGSEPTP